ncbi:hypothetical protein [Spirosoma sp. KNUC1025]|uniref:hypothetical protein n=1 Tax=Spirosoma sp. KNUC1025 TaxID=2894082 RepID=UPI003869D48D|nr:hypothetical protein LN737_32195 [Spirosoma sp. KNUC1025]
MDKVIPIIGTPKQGSYDLVQWGTQLRILEGGNFSAQAIRTVGRLHELVKTTPVYFQEHLKSEAEPDFNQEQEDSYGKRNPYDWASQLRAMIRMDIYRGKTMAELRSMIKAQLLVIVGVQDHMVTPEIY